MKFITAADGIKLTPRGLIETDADTLATSREGVFAGGDVVTGPWIAIGAVAAGREAAISIERYLEGQDLKADREAPLRPMEHGNWNPIPKGQPKAAREHMPELPQAEWTKSFKEINLGFTEAQAQAGGGPVHQLRAVLRVYAVCDGLPGRGHRPQHAARNHRDQRRGRDPVPGLSDLQSHPSARPTITPRLPNVVTSLEFERILSASGPFGGHLVRPSDHQEPKKIAWLQCVGSRDVKYHTYCSSVCCMYAIKEAVIAKEHAPYPLDTAIFFMDMRTFGKDFELYYNRAKDEHGVRFIRSRIHSIDPLPDDNLPIRYADESGEEKIEAFDMIVLSVGMEVSQAARELARPWGWTPTPMILWPPRRLPPWPPPGRASMSAGPCKVPKTFPNRSCRLRPRPGR